MIATRKLVEEDLHELLTKAKTESLTVEEATALVLHDDWDSLAAVTAGINDFEYSDWHSSVPKVIGSLPIDQLRQVDGFQFEEIKKEEAEDSLDVKKRLQEKFIGPLTRSSTIVAQQWKDADIVSGIKPAEMAPENFNASYLHPDATEDTASKIRNLSDQWLRDVNEARKKTKFLFGVVQDIEESTKGNIEIMYSLGFYLKRNFVSDPRLHYFNTDQAVPKSSQFVTNWLKENDKFGKRGKIEKFSKIVDRKYEEMLAIARDKKILDVFDAYMISQGVLEVNGVENPYSWQNEHVVGVSRSYTESEVNRIIRGKHQLNYSEFTAFRTNLPALVNRTKGHLLPIFYESEEQDVWRAEWGQKPKLMPI